MPSSPGRLRKLGEFFAVPGSTFGLSRLNLAPSRGPIGFSTSISHEYKSRHFRQPAPSGCRQPVCGSERTRTGSHPLRQPVCRSRGKRFALRCGRGNHRDSPGRTRQAREITRASPLNGLALPTGRRRRGIWFRGHRCCSDTVRSGPRFNAGFAICHSAAGGRAFAIFG